MKRNWVRRAALAVSIVGFAAGTITTGIAVRGRNTGTVVVGNVSELISAISSQPGYDTIVLSANGSPYDLGEQPCMGAFGHLVVEKGVTLKGQTGHANDIVLVGTTNRILYVKSVGVIVEGLTFKNGNCTTNNILTNLASRVCGGAIYLGLPSNECRIANCIFTNNVAFRGGAIASYKANDPTTIISECRFLGNKAEENGGGCYNSSRMFNCLFLDNYAEKYGGAAYNSTIEQGTSGRNIASKGSEFYECSLSRMSYSGEAVGNASRFHNVFMERSKITATNGYVFSGWFEVRSSAITDGKDICLSSGISSKYYTRYYYEYDDEGETNYISRTDANWPPRFINCTIVNNKRYLLTKPVKEPMTMVDIKNSILYKNTVVTNEGIKVNKYLANNGCMKTVQMTYAQRFSALGWVPSRDGFSISMTCPEEVISLVASAYNKTDDESHSWMDESKSGWQLSGWGKYIDGTITYRQYFHARGWNGDTSKTSFLAPQKEYTIRIDTPAYMDLLNSNYTDNQTWDAYYRHEGWNGISDYTGATAKNYDISPDQSDRFNIAFSIFSMPGSWMYEQSINYIDNKMFDMKFANQESPDNPYAIDTSSPASHKIYPSYGIDDMLYFNNETWIYNSKDLKGAPRLYGGGLDIGAYQGEVFYPFVMEIR